MTYGESDRPEPGGSEARVAAKERARELRTQHKKQERRRRLGLQLGILGGSLVILAVVAVTLVTLNQAPDRGPLNMASDGIKIGADYKAVRTMGLQPQASPVASRTASDGVIDIQLYVDYLCANCGTFEKNNVEQLRSWLESGAATVEIHPIALLTTKSAGTQYSLRAANAAACVAEFSPDRFFDFHDALFSDQPKVGSEGLTDQQLIDRAQGAGVGNLAKVTTCIEKRRFSAWVQAATVRALNGPIPNADIPAITTAPTVIVDGKQLVSTKSFDPQELAQFVIEASGDQYADQPTPAPSATPTPAP